MSHSFVLRGGRVIDPAQKIDGVMDVAFADGKVARVGRTCLLMAQRRSATCPARSCCPASSTCIPTSIGAAHRSAIDAEDFCRRSGVTTAVDTGSAGPGNFMGFRKHVIERSEVRILAFLHVSFAGIYAFHRRHGGRERGNPADGAARRGRGRECQPRPDRRHQGAGRAACVGSIPAPYPSTSRLRPRRRAACR